MWVWQFYIFFINFIFLFLITVLMMTRIKRRKPMRDIMCCRKAKSDYNKYVFL